MVINDSAYYEGKLWCAYELKNRDGTYKEELRLHMRKESQQNKFQCPDCGEKLILCAGPIMEPFFKHHEGSECIESRGSSTKTEFVTKRILYHLAKDSFPDAQIHMHPRIQKGVTPTLLVTNGEMQIVLKYLSSDIKLAEWEAEHAYYAEYGMKDIWFLNKSRYHEDRLTTFEYLISKTSMPLKLIDATSNQLVLKEKCEAAYSKREIIVSRPYPLETVRISSNGEVLCDFEQYREGILNEANKREEDFYQRQNEEIAIRQQQLEERNRRQQEAYLEQIRQKKEELKQKEDKVALRQVLRTPLSGQTNMAGKMRMANLEEAWELPLLQGRDWQIKAANNQRFLYLKQLDMQLKQLSEPNIRNHNIDTAIKKLEKDIQASNWMRGKSI